MFERCWVSQPAATSTSSAMSVSAPSPQSIVSARPSRLVIVSGLVAAEERVRPAAPVDHVVAAAALEHVAAVGADDHVVVRRAEDVLDVRVHVVVVARLAVVRDVVERDGDPGRRCRRSRPRRSPRRRAMSSVSAWPERMSSPAPPRSWSSPPKPSSSSSPLPPSMKSSRSEPQSCRSWPGLAEHARLDGHGQSAGTRVKSAPGPSSTTSVLMPATVQITCPDESEQLSAESISEPPGRVGVQVDRAAAPAGADHEQRVAADRVAEVDLDRACRCA